MVASFRQLNYAAAVPPLVALAARDGPGAGDWRRIDQATNAFGQSISVTPLQMVASVAAIANGGVYMKPYIMDRVQSAASTKVTAPVAGQVDSTYHWHWEIHPRLREIAGLELGTGLPVNPVSPTAFRDADPGDVLNLRACCDDGKPLPRWVRFDALVRSGEKYFVEVGSTAAATTRRSRGGNRVFPNRREAYTKPQMDA